MVYPNQEIDFENYSECDNVDFVGTYQVMEEFVKHGKIRSLGVNNFNVTQKQRLISSVKISPAAFSIEFSAYNK